MINFLAFILTSLKRLKNLLILRIIGRNHCFFRSKAMIIGLNTAYECLNSNYNKLFFIHLNYLFGFACFLFCFLGQPYPKQIMTKFSQFQSFSNRVHIKARKSFLWPRWGRPYPKESVEFENFTPGSKSLICTFLRITRCLSSLESFCGGGPKQPSELFSMTGLNCFKELLSAYQTCKE